MITESRLKTGILTFGASPGVSFACQASNVRVTPSYEDDGDPLETLCGDKIPAGKKESWVLAGSSVQDFDDPDGFLSYCFDNRITTQPFEWQPNKDGAPKWTGQVVIVALEEGGDVNARLTTDWEFALSGTPSRAYSAAVAATGADAGTPGSWTPAGATPPANLTAAATAVANPTTAWATGEYMVLGDSSQCHWDGAAWAAGQAP